MIGAWMEGIKQLFTRSSVMKSHEVTIEIKNGVTELVMVNGEKIDPKSKKAKQVRKEAEESLSILEGAIDDMTRATDKLKNIK